jgi:hypothetical protein
MKDSIYILEAIATHYPDDIYPVVVERKEWVGKGEVGKKKLESIMDEVSKVWKKVYAESDVKIYFAIHPTVDINGLIHKEEPIKKLII